MTNIIGFTLCGTYPSWTDYAIASAYKVVDKLIVINNGYDTKHPELGCTVAEPVNNMLIKKIIEIDKQLENDKIIYISEMTEDSYKMLIDFNLDECARSGNATYANRLARNLGAEWMLHFASDQIFYETLTREKLESLIKANNYHNDGYRFWQYADFIGNLEYHGTLPDNGTNDGSLFYMSKENQHYGGQGAPGTNTQQLEIDYIQTAHMRNSIPFGVDPYYYFYTRFWYHWYAPNTINEHTYNRLTRKKYTIDEICKLAHQSTINMLNIIKNKSNSFKMGKIKDSRAPHDIPEVLKVGIKRYITQQET